MTRGGAILFVAGCFFFLWNSAGAEHNVRYQGSGTDTATPTVSDLFSPTPTETGTETPPGTQTPSETVTETPTVTGPPTETPTITETPTHFLTPTDTPTAASTGTETPEPSMTLTPMETATPTATNSPTAEIFPPHVVISEAAWAGTGASPNDEWIELWNAGAGDVDLSGWILTDGGDIRIALSGVIGAGSFFLLERTDDSTVSSAAADRIYTGALSNSGEALYLLDPSGGVVDSANGDGGPWPAGNPVTRGTMERTGDGPDADALWCSNDGIHRSGSDADGNPINGTPRQAFSGFCGMPTVTSTRSPTPTGSATVTATLTPTASEIRTPFPPQSVVINEVAWGGTAADSNDEWIELWNPGAEAVSLAGWILTDGGDVGVPLEGTIGAGEFFILERGGDDTLSDIPADGIYSGGLANAGEELRLTDPAGSVVDAAGGRPWPAGTAGPAYASMERAGVASPAWRTHTGWIANGRDADGNPVRGTPGRPNSALFPTPSPTGLPKHVRINEFLPKPGSDWNGDGVINAYDEFIELRNGGSDAVDIGGWMLDDNGRGAYKIPAGTWIRPGEFLVFFRGRTRLALSEGGDEVWLRAPDGTRVDGRVYTRTRWPDSAWGLFPDGEGVLRLGFPPTPGEPNRLPDDILHPVKKPLPEVAGGWRAVACGPGAGPLLVGPGFLTTGSEESVREAESMGWALWWNGKCYAWSEPSAGRRFPYSNLLPDGIPPLEGAGWWWEAWYLR